MEIVYVLEISCKNCDTSQIICDSYDSALYLAIDEIVDKINCLSGSQEPELMEELDKVSILIKSGLYNAALKSYADLADTFDYSHVYLSIFTEKIQSQSHRKVSFLSEEISSIGKVEQQTGVQKECPRHSRQNDIGVNICWRPQDGWGDDD